MKRVWWRYLPEFKIRLFDFEFSIDGKWTTLMLNILTIEDYDTAEYSLFQFGWYQGCFYWDVLWFGYIQRKYDDWKDSRA